MKLLIDADIIAYRAGFATEKTKYRVGAEDFEDAKTAKEAAFSRDDVVWSRKEVEPEDKALMIADVMIGDIKARYDGAPATLYLSGVGNFRYSVATRASYKGSRSTAPTHLKAIRAHLIERGAVVSAGEEADDLIGIAATADPTAVICSIDKDLMQIPGKHYNFVTKEEVTVSPKEAVLNFYAQVLSGDATDNVPGLTGIGAVKARRALADCKSPAECWAKCVSMYSQEFGGVRGNDYALEAARLVYLRRKVDEQWNPPSYEAKKTEALANPKESRSRRVPVGA